MVKRKAIDSVDEWLKEGELAASSRQARIETTPQAVAGRLLPTAELVQVQVAGASHDMAVSTKEAANWFWELLGRAGYELW